MPAIITGGTGGGFVVPNSASIPFADNAARDAWAAANLGDLVQNLTIVEVTGSPDNVWYLWRGVSNPASYDNTDWIDATPIIQGQQGATGAQGPSGAAGTGVDFTGFANGDLLEYDAGTGTTKPAPIRLNPASGLIEATVKSVFNPSVGVGAVELLATANILRLRGGGGTFIPLGSAITNSGTGEPLCPSLGNFGDLPAIIQQTDTTETLTLTPGQSMDYERTIPDGIGHVVTQVDVVTVDAGTLRLEVFEDSTATSDKKLLDETKTVAAGAPPITTTIDYDGWAYYQTGETVFIRYSNAGVADITLRGVTIGGDFVPANTLRGHTYSVDTLSSKYPGLAEAANAIHNNAAAEINAIAQKANPVAGDVLLIEDSADSFNKKRISVGSLPLGTGAVPSLHNFSIDIPSRVNVGTNLNVQHTVTFDVSNYSHLSALELIVTDGDDKALTVPIRDGSQTQTITLSGTVTSAATTVMFQLSGTYSGGTVTSEIQVVNVANAQAQEQAYYAARPTNDFASVDLSELTAVDVTQSGTVYTLAQATPNTHIFGIISPDNRDPVSIINTVSGQDGLANGRFTATPNIRNIGGMAANLLTIINNSGEDGTFRYRVTTE